jgi:hypothetical protein
MPMPENVATSIQACAAGLAASCAEDVEEMLSRAEKTTPVQTIDLLGNGFICVLRMLAK